MLHLKTILLGGSAKHFLPSTSQRAFSRVIASGLVLHTHWLGKNLMTTSSRISIFQCREYHFTMLVAAKAKGGKKGKGGQDADDDSATAAAAVELPKIKSMEPQIEKIFRRLDEEFAKHRVGKVSGDVFNELPVGNSGLIRDVGQVTVKSPTKVSVSVYDATVTGLVVDAIKGCGMGLNPTVEGSTIIINIPKPSKEARDAMVKMIGKVAEKSKQEVRQVRKEFLDEVKKAKKTVSEDDVKKVSKEADTFTEKNIAKIAQLVKDKETSIMSS